MLDAAVLISASQRVSTENILKRMKTSLFIRMFLLYVLPLKGKRWPLYLKKFATFFYRPVIVTDALGFFMIHSFKILDGECFQEDRNHIILFAMAIIL